MPLPQSSIVSFIFFIRIVFNFPYYFPHRYRPAYGSIFTFFGVTISCFSFCFLTCDRLRYLSENLHCTLAYLSSRLPPGSSAGLFYERSYFQNEIWKFPLHDELIFCFKVSEINNAATQNLLLWLNFKPSLVICTELSIGSIKLKNVAEHMKYIHLFVCFRRNSPQWARASSFMRLLYHTRRRTTVGRIPLDEWSSRRGDLYLTTNNSHNRQTPIPPVGFELTISAGERPKIYALDCTASWIGKSIHYIKCITIRVCV